MTDMYLISGFLGAGKTTLIQKLLTEAFKSKKVALIENDFGDFSMDAALLREGGYQVRELNAGCICCSLTGDFTTALASLLKTYRPDVVLIEPSGVGKLSDVERACRDRRFATSARITQKITVVDVKRCASYLENFGAFFEDQVRSAGTILLNRTELFPEAVTKAVELVEQLNPSAQVLAEPWKLLTAAEILSLPKETEPTDAQPHEEHTCSCGHHHHHHGHACCCHPHARGGADDTFDTMTLHLPQVFSPEGLGRCLRLLGSECCGQVLRAKGIVETETGFLNVQFLPGEHRFEKTNLQEHELCVIGHDLNRAQITAVFEGVC